MAQPRAPKGTAWVGGVGWQGTSYPQSNSGTHMSPLEDRRALQL